MAVKTKTELKTDAGSVFVGGNADISADEVKTLLINMIDSLFGSGSSSSVTVTGSLEDDGNGSIQLDGDASDPGANKRYGTDENGVKGWQDAQQGANFSFETLFIPLQPPTFEAGGAAGHQRLKEANGTELAFWGVPNGTEIESIYIKIFEPPAPSAPSVNFHWGDATNPILSSNLTLSAAETWYEGSITANMAEIPWSGAPSDGSGNTNSNGVDFTAFKRLEMLNETAINEVAGMLIINLKKPMSS